MFSSLVPVSVKGRFAAAPQGRRGQVLNMKCLKNPPPSLTATPAKSGKSEKQYDVQFGKPTGSLESGGYWAQYPWAQKSYTTSGLSTVNLRALCEQGCSLISILQNS